MGAREFQHPTTELCTTVVSPMKCLKQILHDHDTFNNLRYDIENGEILK